MVAMPARVPGPGTDDRPDPGSHERRLARLALPAALLVCALACAAALWTARGVPRGVVRHIVPSALLATAAWGVVGGLVAAVHAWRRPRASAPALRWLCVALIAGWLAQLAWLPFYRAPWSAIALASAFGLYVFALLLVRTRAARAPGRALRALDFTAFTQALALVLGELVLRAAAAASDSPLLDSYGMDRREWIEQNRREPGSFHLGFPIDSRGNYDDEPRARAPGERLITVVGDSFSLGVVPHSHHYTTLAERLLGGAQIYNVGVPGADPPEYLYMLRDDVLPLKPDLIVVSLFFGNDFPAPAAGERRSGLLKRALDRREVLLLQTPRRVLALRAERARQRAAGRVDGQIPVGDEQAVSADPLFSRRVEGAELAARMPWLEDPRREPPSFSPQKFMEIEKARAEQMCTVRAHPSAALEQSIDLLVELAGTTPIGFLLIPDEAQVEEPLWRSIEAASSARLERELPQQLIRAFLERRGLPYVDLLPRLLALQPDEQGLRRVYHLRDTHFNARGNRIAARGLLDLLQSMESRAAPLASQGE